MANENQQRWWNKIFGGNESISSGEANRLAGELENLRLAGYDPVLLEQSKALSEAFREAARTGGKISSYQVAAAYASIYTKVVDTRKKMITEVDRMTGFYLVDTIITQLTDDTLSPEPGTGKVVDITSPKPEIQAELEFLENAFSLNQLITTVTPEIIKYGDYFLRTEVNVSKDPSVPANTTRNDYDPGKDGAFKQSLRVLEPEKPSKDDGIDNGGDEYGLTGINDDVDQASIVPLTNYGDVLAYLTMSEKTAAIRIEKKEPADYIRFSLGTQRIRLDLRKEFGLKNEELDKMEIPRFIRMGKSILFPILGKLKELELLESLVPASKLNKLSNGSIVGVNVPAGYDIEKAIDASKRVEGLLNRKVGVDDKNKELTIENIITAAGKIKVVPIFGDKGNLNKLDYQPDEPDEMLASAKDIREIILSSAGIPYEILFGGEEGKGTTLKKYSRYLRRLRALQKALEDGVRQVIYIHLENKGIEFEPEDIKIEFYNKLIEVDNLDKLEFMDTTVQMLGNLKTFVTELADPAVNPQIAQHIDLTEFIEFLNEQLNIIGFNNVIRKKGDQNNPTPENPDIPTTALPNDTQNPTGPTPPELPAETGLTSPTALPTDVGLPKESRKLNNSYPKSLRKSFDFSKEGKNEQGK
jgi:hypothetical protein